MDRADILQAFKLSRKKFTYFALLKWRSVGIVPLYLHVASPRHQKDIDVESWPYISYMTRIHISPHSYSLSHSTR